MELQVQSRSVFGKRNSTLRSKGLIPGVIYGKHKKETIQIAFAKNEFLKLYKKAGTSSVVDLVGDHKEMVLIYNIQVDWVTNNLLHVDFLAVKSNVEVTAEVPVVLVWESPLAKSWEWRLELLRGTISVKALPKNLPHEIALDVSRIVTLEDGIFMRDINLWWDVIINEDPNLAVVAAVEIERWDEETKTETVA